MYACPYSNITINTTDKNKQFLCDFTCMNKYHLIAFHSLFNMTVMQTCKV